MRILFIGDIVGQPGMAILKKALPLLIAREGLDLVIANAENASGGSRAFDRRHHVVSVDDDTRGVIGEIVGEVVGKTHIDQRSDRSEPPCSKHGDYIVEAVVRED